MNNPMKTIFSRMLWLVPAIVLTISSCSKSGDKTNETKEDTDTPVFENFAAYKAAGTTASVRENRLRKKSEYDGNTLFVIYGVDMNSDNFKNGDFIWCGDVSSSDELESSYDGVSYPLCKAVMAQRKSTIDMLAPDADTFIIDGEKATRARYDALPGDSIQRVSIDGTTLHIEKLLKLGKTTVESDKVSDDEGRLMRQTFYDEMFRAAIEMDNKQEQ